MRATVRTLQNSNLAGAAMERYAEALRAAGHGVAIDRYGSSSETEPETAEEVARLWLERPARCRVERTARNGHEEHVLVDDGERVWSFSPWAGAVVYASSGGGCGFELQADAAGLLGRYELAVRGEAECAGRRGVLVDAVERAVDERLASCPQLLPVGADRHELVVDAERGVVLRATSFLDGEPFQTTEVVEIAFDEEFPAETFAFSPPPGEEVAPAEEAFPRPRDVTIEEATHLVPFTVLAPAPVPADGQLHVFVVPGNERTGAGPAVSVQFSPNEGGHGISIDESTDPGRVPGLEWERLETGERSLRIASLAGQTYVTLEHLGTTVVVSSTLDREALVELALSLEPAPTELPRLSAE